jgi:hypothetical protein
MFSGLKISKVCLFKLVISAIFLASRANTSESRIGSSVEPRYAGRNSRIAGQQCSGLLRSTYRSLSLRGGGGAVVAAADVQCAPDAVSKDCVVVVLRGTPENSECPATKEVISTLQREVGGGCSAPVSPTHTHTHAKDLIFKKTKG